MGCQKARQFIDQLVNQLGPDVDVENMEAALEIGSSKAPKDTEREWSEITAHVVSCPECTKEWNELVRARRLLQRVAGDEPTEKEIESMWTAISAAAVPPLLPRWSFPPLGRVWRFAAACIAFAAIVVAAHQLGSRKFEDHTRTVTGRPALLTQLDSPPRKTAQRIGAAATNGWGVPVHPDQFASASDERGHRETKKRRAPSRRKAKKMKSRLQSGDGAGVYFNDSVASSGSTAEVEEEQYGSELVRPSHASPGQTGEGGSTAKMIRYSDASADEVQRLIETLKTAPEGRSRRIRPSDGETEQQAPTTPQQPSQAKIIKTGVLSVEVESYTNAVRDVETIVGQYSAFVADTTTREKHGGALSGQLVIRVGPADFEQLFAALKRIGRVEAENVEAADVTAEYVDIEARIQSLRITEVRLQELIKSKSFVDKMSTLLEVEREMTRVRSEIESYQGQLRVMSDRIALSTITMSIEEPARTVPTASLSVEVAELTSASDSLANALSKSGARLAAGKTSKRDNGTLRGEFHVHVSLAAFSETVDAIEGLGRVSDRQVRDLQFGAGELPWAKDVLCSITLVLYERAFQRPSGSLQVEVSQIAPTLAQLTAALATSDASIVSNLVSQQDDGTELAYLTLRVRAGQFGTLVSSLEPLGRVTEKNIAGDVGNVVGGGADVPCDLSLTLVERPREVPAGSMVVEIASFDAAREQLSKFIDAKDVQVLYSTSSQRADDTWTGSFRLGVQVAEMESFVARIEELGRVESRQISGLGLGDLSKSDPDALGTLHLSIAEKSTISPSSSRTSASIRGRLRDGLTGLYESIGLIAYGLIVLAPWLLIVVLLAWLATRFLRRRTSPK